MYTCFGCANRPPEKVVNQLRKMLESEGHGVWSRQARQTSTYFCAITDSFVVLSSAGKYFCTSKAQSLLVSSAGKYFGKLGRQVLWY